MSPNQPAKDAYLEAILEAILEAALGGHQLGPWQRVDDGWRAAYQRCQMTTWIGDKGLRYSLLDDSCPEHDTAAPP